MTVYDFSATDIGGTQRSLAEFAGKVLLIVNTASACGFTSQYAGLQALQQKFAGDFVVLGFPCNQFGAQERGSADEIASFCDLTYKVRFPIFSKIDVKGATAHPLYTYLTGEMRGIFGTRAIKWNFTKFLIDRTGKPVARYAPITKPASLESDIAEAIAA